MFFWKTASWTLVIKLASIECIRWSKVIYYIEVYPGDILPLPGETLMYVI